MKLYSTCIIIYLSSKVKEYTCYKMARGRRKGPKTMRKKSSLLSVYSHSRNRAIKWKTNAIENNNLFKCKKCKQNFASLYYLEEHVHRRACRAKKPIVSLTASIQYFEDGNWVPPSDDREENLISLQASTHWDNDAFMNTTNGMTYITILKIT